MTSATGDHEYVDNSAAVFYFDNEYGIADHELITDVSDHYPVYSVFRTDLSDDDPPVPDKIIIPAVPGKIIIHDVLADAPGREPDNEYITLKNIGGQSVNTGGWKLTDGEGTYPIPPGTTIAPGETWTVYGRQYNPIRNTRGLFLNNNHDSVSLYDAAGKLIDFMSW